MLDRFLVRLGAGMVTAGVAAAMVAGAGIAYADSPTGADTKVTTSSASAKPTENKPDSAKDGTPKPKPNPKPKPSGTKPKPGSPVKSDKTAVRPVTPTTTERNPAAKPVVRQAVEAPTPLAAPTPTFTAAKIATTAETPTAPETAAVAFAAATPSNADITATARPTPFSGLLSFIGTVVFNLYAFATRLVGGPPIVPPNSTVTVNSSTLRINCGSGYVVPADWYVPAGSDKNPPQRLIYLQHGFLASGPWYSYTAATLADQTDSIVVAPSLTSNFLSCDACWLGAPRMQQAVANLFEDGNTALADSALPAGYTEALPQRVVLVGHSLGGGLVAGAAGDMVDNNTVDKLAGVVMLDGVGLDGSMTQSLEKVPDGIPIYQLASPAYFWNQFGVGSDALLAARPDRFVGVTLVGGSHVDSMRGGNPLIQFSEQLVAGFSKPQNVAAAQILMVGWVNDMFAGTRHDGIYGDGDLTHEISIDTPAGQATAVPLPNSLTKPFLLNPLQPLVPLGIALFTFEPTCVAKSMGVCEESMAA